jgi:hypothetical protein
MKTMKYLRIQSNLIDINRGHFTNVNPGLLDANQATYALFSQGLRFCLETTSFQTKHLYLEHAAESKGHEGHSECII